MKTNRIIVSILLILCTMCCLFAVMSMTVNAAGEVCAIGSAKYATLDAALKAVPIGGAKQTTIKLLTDITHKTNCSIINKKITFDLNGKNLIFTGDLIVDDGSIVDYIGSGKFEVNVTCTNHGDLYEYNALTIMKGSTCKLKGVTIIDIGNGIGRRVYGIYCDTNSDVIVDGDVSAESSGDDSYSWSYAIYAVDGSTVTVNGNIAVKSNGNGVRADNGAMIIVNGNITAVNGISGAETEGYGAIVIVYGNIIADKCGAKAYDSGEIVVGGNITANKNGVVASGSNATVTVVGNITANETGVFAVVDATIIVYGNITAHEYGIIAWNGNKVIVNGIITVTDSAKYVKLDCVEKKYKVDSLKKTPLNIDSTQTQNYLTYTDGRNTVYVWETTPVCTIVGTSAQYNTLSAALAAVPIGGAKRTVIKLLTDITYPIDCIITNKKITFNLNGKNLIFTGGLAVSDGATVDYTGSGKFEVNNSTTSGDAALYVMDGSTCMLTGVLVTEEGSGAIVTTNSKLTVNGNITVTNGYGVFAIEGATVILNGNITADEYGAGALNSSNITVKGNITVTDRKYAFMYDDGSKVTVIGTITVTDPPK